MSEFALRFLATLSHDYVTLFLKTGFRISATGESFSFKTVFMDTTSLKQILQNVKVFFIRCCTHYYFDLLVFFCGKLCQRQAAELVQDKDRGASVVGSKSVWMENGSVDRDGECA